MKKQMIRSLTFQSGNAEAAMNFYVELFEKFPYCQPESLAGWWSR